MYHVYIQLCIRESMDKFLLDVCASSSHRETKLPLVMFQPSCSYDQPTTLPVIEEGLVQALLLVNAVYCLHVLF